MGEVTEMPSDRLDPMFSEAPTRYSPSLGQKSEPSMTPSSASTGAIKTDQRDRGNSNPKLQKNEKPE
jgi:hypothetical protein